MALKSHAYQLFVSRKLPNHFPQLTDLKFTNNFENSAIFATTTWIIISTISENVHFCEVTIEKQVKYL